MSKLIETKTGRELKVGDKVVDFRGEEAVLLALHPRSGRNGHVQIVGRAGLLYPSVFGAEFQPDVPTMAEAHNQAAEILARSYQESANTERRLASHGTADERAKRLRKARRLERKAREALATRT